jgi:steroid delta-isomerase-like uncharacterized protein
MESTMLTVQDKTTLVHSFYDAFNKRDMTQLLSLVTTDVKWTNVPFNTVFEGHKGYREFIDNWTTAMPDCKVELVTVIVDDERAAIEFIARGTHTGPLVGPQGTIPATQKRVEMKCSEFLKIKDGQVIKGRVYFDAATLLHQLGLSKNETPQPVAVAR